MAKRTYIPKSVDLAKELKLYIDRYSVTMKQNMDNDGPAELDTLRSALVNYIDVTQSYVLIDP